MSNLKNADTQPPRQSPALHTILEVSLAPLAQSSTSNSSLSPLPTKSKLAPDLDSSTHVPPSCAAAATTQTINITTLNITYGGGDSYNGDIRNGCVGGRRNEYYFESRSDTPPPPPPPPPPSPLLFAADSTTLTLALGAAGIAMMLMLLRR